MNQAQRLGRAAAYASWAQYLSHEVDRILHQIGQLEYEGLGDHQITSRTDRLMGKVAALTAQAKRCAHRANREAVKALT
jgi:hypothetical protein